MEQVLALAPDPASAKSGKDLSAPRKWKTLGADEACAWGTIQGSGKDPYQTSIDFSAPAFKCTCPSRKFPCKHGLGLFLIVARQPGAMTEKQSPAWTTEWLAKRREKEEKAASKEAPASTAPDPDAEKKAAAAAEKRATSREAKVTAGLDELRTWLSDLVRGGFATLPGKSSSFWETPAARLVDAQAPGLARRVRALDGITTTGQEWPGRLLGEAAWLHLACESWTRAAALPPPVQADLRATIGFTTGQEEVLAQAGTRDQWLVIGQRIEEEENLRVQRTWLWGRQTNRFGLSLSFSAASSQPLDLSLPLGTVLDAELAFYPGAWPLRVLIKQRHGSPQTAGADLPHRTIRAANVLAAEAFTANPWLERVPFALNAVVPLRRGQSWIVRDSENDILPLEIQEAKGWTLVSMAGGRPIGLAGEWNGARLAPLSVWAEGRFLKL